MNIVFNCPGCGAILRMKEEYGGKRGRCPHCQGAITVPAIESDAGMDLLPLDDSSGDGPGGPHSAGPAAGNLSLNSRFGKPASAGHEPRAMPVVGDSNLGLAPLEDPTAKNSASAKGTASHAPTPASAANSAKSKEDSSLGLAPLETLPAKSTPAVAAAAPAMKSEAGESAIGLAPLPDVKEKPAPVATPAKKTKSAADDDDLRLAPLDSAAATKTAPPQVASAPAKDAAGGGAVNKPSAPSDEPARIACTKCGAKMRVPPNAAGKSVVCPKCKNKFRIRDAAPTAPAPAAKQADSDSFSMSDTPSTGADLGGGMLDMLGDSGLPAGDTAAAESRSMGLAAPKLSGGKSSSGSILGLPPLAVYGGAAGIALIFALGLVYLLGGFSSTSSVVQAPAVTTTPATPTAPPVNQTPAQTAPAPQTTSTPPTSPSAPTPATPAVPAPTAIGALGTPVPSPSTPNPSGSPTPAAPGTTPPAMAAAAGADPANWKQRVPIVRSADAAPRPGETPVPPTNPGEAQQFLREAHGSQEQLIENFRKITDVDSARRVAPACADVTATGLDKIRQLRRFGGAPKQSAEGEAGDSMIARALAKQNAAKEPEMLAQIDTELQRIAAIPDAMPILEAALAEKAVREPDGALAAALTERGVAFAAPAAPQ